MSSDPECEVALLGRGRARITRVEGRIVMVETWTDYELPMSTYSVLKGEPDAAPAE